MFAFPVSTARTTLAPGAAISSRMMENETWVHKTGGKVHTVDVTEAYVARIVSDITLARPLKVVVDCGNGIAGATAPAIFRAIL